MEDEVGIKVTRLRRRLSVESDDVKSPSTPTKKRGGRLAAKPQLELIDENAPEATPKRSSKSTVKEVAEPIEEKTVTPARRSARVRSNTSTVSETPGDVAEDKNTPSRRSTRIKSNTSLIADPVNLNSPRAKRAARRLSQVGSDNEAPITPARQTRRTRKDSASSIDKTADPIGKLGGEIKEVIAEESENVKETKNTDRSKNDSPSLRKSPRLIRKSEGKSSAIGNDNKENEPESDKAESETVAPTNKSVSEPKPEQATEVKDGKASEQINLSANSKNLIQELEEAPKKAKSIFNKSTTAVEESQVKTKRNRTKSWTTISVESPHETSFCSDSEASIKKNKKKNETLNFSNMSGSGDGLLKVTSKNEEANKELEDVSLNSSTLSNKKKKKKHEMSMSADTETSVHEVSKLNASGNKSTSKISEDKDKEENNQHLVKAHDSVEYQQLFGRAPCSVVETVVYIEDSDSNHEIIEKENNDKSFHSGDQCVPVVDHQLAQDETSKNPQSNLSYEPMDIDETMPDNISLNFDKEESASENRKSTINSTNLKNDSVNKSKRKSSMPNMTSEDIIDQGSNKSPRKSSITEMINNEVEDNNKSKRKSSISNVTSEDTTNGIFEMSHGKLIIDMEHCDESMNKKSNKSKRKSSMSNVIDQITDEDSNKSPRKSLDTDNSNDQSMKKESNKSKRKSSISNVTSEDTTDGIFNVSHGKLIIDLEHCDESMNKKSNKSKRKSSISNMIETITDDDSNNSQGKSLDIDKSNDQNITKETNKSKRKSSISNIVPDENTNEISNKSTRKSSVPDLATDENLDNSLTKSKRKSSVTAMAVEVSMDKVKTSVLDDDNDDDDMVNKSSNKSKRKSSISNVPKNVSIEKSADKSLNKSALHLDNSDDNKSTLVLSQLKDISENEVNSESNVAKESNDSNEQLSKSVPQIATEKDTDKKNLSLTYSTSTPLQQKTMKKLGLQINSSIIAPNSASKIEKIVEADKLKKGSSTMSEEDGSDSSEEEEDADSESEDVEEDSEEESSFRKSKLIDDKAEEASDDYESGDSRDEDEIEYEKQNEIREKGETLDSDEAEFSDDSNYEKDSFIVSSDEEDNGLLSGSGDDLSMSADELTMTEKSKKKFNERKIKEQKKASREMYEARHKLNESDKSAKSPNSKSKKHNRQRFDTSSSESDEEVVAQSKKNRRQRIDSSHDASTLKSDADQTLSKKKKKKAKQLSESECDENEKEITICDENQTENVDPLTLNVIKEEPKTPQKELNISTVAVTDMDEVEEVDIDENVTIMKTNQSSDPLQATIAENDDEDNTDEGSISENEEITQNYESVLLNLNKSGSKKIKSSNISLDFNKKTKQKSKEPIVDQLNLTQVKTSKKKNAETTEAAGSKKLEKSQTNNGLETVNKENFSEGSSDSIDMKLLFPEDSNDSEVVTNNKNKDLKEPTQTEYDEEAPDNFIPLKKSQGKTNIFENMDNITSNSNDESILNVSGKKKNKRKSSQSEEALALSAPEDDNFRFFIDTAGTHTSDSKIEANTSVKNSAKINKQKKNVSIVNIEEAAVDDDSNDAPLEISYRSEKNKSKQDLNITQITEEIEEASAPVGTPNQSGKKKKKNKKGLNSSQYDAEISVIESTDDAAEKSFNTSMNKKKKKKLSESQVAQEPENETPAEPILNISLGSAKKLKQKSAESTTIEIENEYTENEDVNNQELVTKKRKRKSSANQTIDEIIIKDDVELTKFESIPTKNEKKKRKISNNDEDINTQVEDLIGDTQEQAPVENTKKKSKTLPNLKVDEIGEVAAKKNKKRKERDDDDASEISKVLKQNSFDKVHIPRLPANVIKQLDDKPKKDVAVAKKTKVVSTSEFVVQETKRRRNKPSNYLEESVYCTNDDADEKTQKRSVKNPKVLPFIPTAATSHSGFTTNFRVNVISQQTKFVAQSSDVSNFKNDYLLKKRIKKLGTFEMYKRQRNIKIAKF